MCESTMKYFSPSFSYKANASLAISRSLWQTRRARAPGWPGRGQAGQFLGARREVEADELGRVLRVGEHDRPVVLVDHPAVVRRHVLLELGRVEEAGLLAERLGDLVVDHVHPAD